MRPPNASTPGPKAQRSRIWISRSPTASSWCSSVRPDAESRQALRMLAGLEEVTSGRIMDRRPQCRQDVSAQGSRHRDGVPELRPLPAYERRREHGFRAEDGRECRRMLAPPGCARRPSCSIWRSSSIASPRHYREVSANGSRWDERSCGTPRCSCMDEPFVEPRCETEGNLTRSQIASSSTAPRDYH